MNTVPTATPAIPSAPTTKPTGRWILDGCSGCSTPCVGGGAGDGLSGAAAVAAAGCASASKTGTVMAALAPVVPTSTTPFQCFFAGALASIVWAPGSMGTAVPHKDLSSAAPSFLTSTPAL